jgi:hypothetical protein
MDLMDLLKGAGGNVSSKEYQDRQRFEMIFLLAKHSIDSMITGHLNFTDDEVTQIVRSGFALGTKIIEHGDNLHRLMCSHTEVNSDAEPKKA